MDGGPTSDAGSYSEGDVPRTIYQVRVRGRLGERWTHQFEGVTIAWLDDDTLLTGAADQAALHGLLKRVRDLGMSLVSVTLLKSDEAEDKT